MKNKNTIIFKILILLTAIVTGLGFAARTQASEVTEYSQQTSITKDGEPLTSDSTVKTNETLSVTTNFTFPAAQTIAEGDTLTFKLPEELSLITALNFDVYDVVNHTGELVGTAQTDPATHSVTVTFSNYFTNYTQKKELSLTFNVRMNNEKVKESGPVAFKFGQTDFSFQYQKEDGTAGEYEMKYGYQDSSDPSIVKWRIILNARQDMLRNMVISDNFGDGLTLVPGTLRAVRYAPVEGGIRNEAHLLTLPVLDNFTNKAVLTQNANGDANGFTINFGDNYNWPMYIEYSTRVPEGTKVGDVVNNKLSWTAKGFPERTITKSVRLEDGSGKGSAVLAKDVKIQAQKKLVNKELEKGQFTFGLFDENGNLLQTVTNEADGSINFKALNYSAAGTYRYSIKEIPGNDPNYVYDDKEAQLTVTVTDVNGEFLGSVKYDLDPVFTNTYRGNDPGKSVQPPTPGNNNNPNNTPNNNPNNTPGNGNNTPGNSSDNPKGGTDNPGNGNNNSNNGTNDPGAAGGNKKVLPKTGQETTLWLSLAGLAILVSFESYVFLQKKTR